MTSKRRLGAHATSWRCRPLRGDEIELVRASAAIEAELAGSPGALSERVIAYYRHWLGVSGVIAGSLPASQQRFFAAVRGATQRC